MDSKGKVVDNEAVKPEAVDAGALEAKIPAETGGPKGPEPTRYGDWEIAGKCVDF